jgi:putative ABC transport system permease protein
MMYNLCYLRRYWPRQLAIVVVVAAATVTFVLLTAAMDSLSAIMALGTERDNVTVVARGGLNEQWPELSHIAPDQVSQLATVPGIARGPGGPLISPELLYAAEVRVGGRHARVTLRGVGDQAFAVHRILTPGPGADEALRSGKVVVGSGVRDLLGNVAVGEELTFLGRSWQVGAFFAPAGTQTQYDSEIWVPLTAMMKARRTDAYGIAAVKAESAASVGGIVDKVNMNQDLLKDLRATPEAKTSSVMTSALTTFRVIHRIFSFLLMGVAGVGVINAMLNNVMRRRRDMALLRALGASGWSVAFGFILEGMILATAGAVVGSCLSLVGRNTPITIGTLSRGAPLIVHIQFGPEALLTAIAIGAAFGAVCALVPAAFSTRFTVRAELAVE